VREGVDCVIRGGNPRDSTLVVRRLAMMPQVICASPQYLKNFGTPRTPDELLTHRAIKFFASSGNVDYPFELIVNEQTRQFAANGWMSVNDAENYVVCAVSGCGLIQLPRFHVEEELRSGQLVEVLAEWPSPDLPVSALYPYRRQLSLRIRVFIDWVSRLYEEKFGAYSQKISP